MRPCVQWPCWALAVGFALTGGGARAGEAQEAVFEGVRARQPLARRTPAPESPAPTPVPAFPDPILQQAPPPTGNFLALPDSNGNWPPDTDGAVGPTRLMVMLNTQVRFQDKNGVPTGLLLPLNVFWSSMNGGSGADDPRVVYDPLATRWIAVGSDDAGSVTTGGVLIGVSKTQDPTVTVAVTDAWSLFKIPTPGYWPDRPTVGFNKNWVVVSVNLYDAGGLVGSRVYAINRASLFGSPATLSFTSIDLPGQLGIVPAASYGDSIDPMLQPDELYLLQSWSPTTGQLRLYRLALPLGSETIQPVATVADTPSVPWSDGVGLADFAPQLPSAGSCQCALAPCAPHWIHVGDSRIQNVVYRNGHLWAAQTIFLPTGGPTRSSIQWWEIDLSGNVLQRGLVDDPTGVRFFAYPSLAANKNDDVLLGYSRFQADQFAGASYSFRTAIDPLGTMQSERMLKDGEACYFKDPLSSGTNQWGAYSAAAVDPSDDQTLWTVQEYAAPANNTSTTGDRWGTWWGSLDPTPRVAITDAVASEAAPPGTSRLTFDLSLLTSDLSLPLPTSQQVTVQWATAPGSATPGADYDAVPSGTVIFAPGETVKTIQVTVRSDTLVEVVPETLFVNLSPPVNAVLSDSQAQGTILDLPPPRISIGDVTKVEGNGGAGATAFSFPVTLSHPSETDVSVEWSTADWTAVAGPLGTGDFIPVNPTPLTFTAGDATPQIVTVYVHGDSIDEGDEAFYVVLSNVSPNATLLPDRAVGRILDDDAVRPGVLGLSILSDSTGPGPGNTGRNRLQWVNPPGASFATQILIRYNEGPSCASPTDTASGNAVPPPQPSSAPGKASYEHTGLTLGRQYCYTVWLDYGGTLSPASSQSGRPFDSTLSVTNRVRWKLSTGASLMPAPTVGSDAVIAVSNDMNVHALQRDPASATGGLWPAAWTPLGLGALAHHRVPVVPRVGYRAAFITTEDGRIHAVDTRTGDLLWSTLLPERAATGAPAGIFITGSFNYVLVGTSSSSLADHFYALDPDTGAVIDAFPGPADNITGELGEVLGMASVDYATGRVYFASRRGGAGASLWCLELGLPSDALRLRWSRDLGADVDGSPVLRGWRVYVGDNTGKVWSIPATTGVGGYSRSVGATAVKGFLFPDRGGRDLYAATDTAVVGLTDDGTGLLLEKWRISLVAPSIVLLRPGTSELYVGVRSYSGVASLVRIDTTTGVVAGNVPLEAGPQTVGAPSLDIEYGGVIHVGGEPGILYAVQLPF